MSPNWHLRSGYPSPCSVPVSTVSIPKYTILQRRHTQTKTEEKDKAETETADNEILLKERVASRKAEPIKRLAEVLKDSLIRAPRELSIRVHLEALSTGKGATTKALVDSGCTNCFMDLEWAKRVGLEPSPLLSPITMYNVDGTQNRDGKIRYGMELLVTVGDHRERIHFLLGKTQSHMVILGHDWLKRHNPEIDWMKAEVKLTRCPKTCASSPYSHQLPARTPVPPKASTLASASIPDTRFPNSGPTPDWPSRYPLVFSEAKWDELPRSRPDFDIKIEFKTDPGHLSSKLYSLTREEMVEMN